MKKKVEKKVWKSVMGVDECGRFYHDLGDHSRKELMERLGTKSCRKMFVDTKDGVTKHVGYVVGRRWIRLYYVTEWEGKRG